jgi:putative hemolysin
MNPFLAEIILLIALILVNGLFTMSELAVLSARKVRLQKMAEDGSIGAQRALDLGQSPSRFLSTVQVVITLVGILMGAIGGAGLSAPLAKMIARVSFLAETSEEIAVFLIAALITFFSLIAGELVPKRLALAYPERIAAGIAGPMRLFSRLALPLVVVLDAATGAVLRILRVRPADEPPITHAEIKDLFYQGTEVGVFEAAETTMVEGVLRLGDRLVGALMTPRTEIEWLDLDDPRDANLKAVIESPHSHFPLARGTLDELIGIVRAKDVLAHCQGSDKNLDDFVLPPVFLPESTPALAALEKLRTASGNLALVIDEFGGVLGMVTLFDVMEALVGVIAMEGVTPPPPAVRREDGSWLIDGMMPVDQFKEIFKLEDLPDEKRVGYQTVAGLVLTIFREIPKTGQQSRFSGLRFEVVDMDGLRIDKVLVRYDPD